MTKRWLKVVSVAAVIAGSVPGMVAHASIPTWASGPAVLAKQVFTGSLGNETVIVGFAVNPAAGTMIVNSDACGNLWKTNGEVFSGAGVSWDGDPAVAYSGGASNQFWTCAHGTGTNKIYCAKGHLVRQGCSLQPIFSLDETTPQAIGTNTFLPHQAPAMVRYQSVFGTWVVALLGVGTNNQIWISTRADTGAWGNWTQLPVLAGGFDRAPGVTTLGPGTDGRLIVCSRQASNWKYACVSQAHGPGGSVQWGSWAEIPSFPQVNSRPALTLSNSSIYVFGIGLAFPNPTFVSSQPIGGGAWSGNLQVGTKTGFAYGPAAAGVSSGPWATAYVMNIARADDGAYWWDAGSGSGWNTNWLRIQTVN